MPVIFTPTANQPKRVKSISFFILCLLIVSAPSGLGPIIFLTFIYFLNIFFLSYHKFFTDPINKQICSQCCYIFVGIHTTVLDAFYNPNMKDIGILLKFLVTPKQSLFMEVPTFLNHVLSKLCLLEEISFQ